MTKTTFRISLASKENHREVVFHQRATSTFGAVVKVAEATFGKNITIDFHPTEAAQHNFIKPMIASIYARTPPGIGAGRFPMASMSAAEVDLHAAANMRRYADTNDMMHMLKPCYRTEEHGEYARRMSIPNTWADKKTAARAGAKAKRTTGINDKKAGQAAPDTPDTDDTAPDNAAQKRARAGIKATAKHAASAKQRRAGRQEGPPGTTNPDGTTNTRGVCGAE